MICGNQLNSMTHTISHFADLTIDYSKKVLQSYGGPVHQQGFEYPSFTLEINDRFPLKASAREIKKGKAIVSIYFLEFDEAVPENIVSETVVKEYQYKRYGRAGIFEIDALGKYLIDKADIGWVVGSCFHVGKNPLMFDESSYEGYYYLRLSKDGLHHIKTLLQLDLGMNRNGYRTWSKGTKFCLYKRRWIKEQVS